MPLFVSRKNRDIARKQFLVWLGNNHPNVAAAANPNPGFDASMAALAADYSITTPSQNAASGNDDSWWKSLAKGITEIAPQIITSKQQYDLMKLNLRRAEAGQPPIDSAAIAPTVRIQAETSPAQNRTFLMGAGIVGAAILGALLLKRGR